MEVVHESCIDLISYCRDCTARDPVHTSLSDGDIILFLVNAHAFRLKIKPVLNEDTCIDAVSCKNRFVVYIIIVTHTSNDHNNPTRSVLIRQGIVTLSPARIRTNC